MATASTDDDLLDDFLTQHGHEIDRPGWKENYNKKQCPECSGLHDLGAVECTVCGWRPRGN